MTETTETNAKRKREKKKGPKKGKWTRRGFIGAGLVAGGALVVGVAIRPGDRTEKLAKYVTGEGEHLLAVWVKIAEDNTITTIIPHGEMGQGVHTALSAMLAEEMDADWSALKIMEAPAEKDYANFPLVREFLMGGKSIPGSVFDTLNGGSGQRLGCPNLRADDSKELCHTQSVKPQRALWRLCCHSRLYVANASAKTQTSQRLSTHRAIPSARGYSVQSRWHSAIRD